VNGSAPGINRIREIVALARCPFAPLIAPDP
jgi:hypothetical protein